MVSWIQTYTGLAFDLREPTADMVDIRDIAWALSGQQRYAAHTRFPVSVAYHSVLIADWLYNDLGDPLYALAGLLHDAHEAYITDVPSPVLECLPYLAKEALNDVKLRIDQAIAAKILPRHRNGLVGLMRSDVVKSSDLRILMDERNAALGKPPKPWFTDEFGIKPLGVTVEEVSRDWAEDVFLERLDRYVELTQGEW